MNIDLALPARRSRWPAVVALALLAGVPRPVVAQGWPTYGKDSQHTCLSHRSSALPQAIRWSAPVDLDPAYTQGGELLIHYGSPVITLLNTVISPVKTGAGDGFKVEARRGKDGTLLWSFNTDYSLPGHNWTPICGVSLSPGDLKLAIPGAGGTIYLRSLPDFPNGPTGQLAFYGINNYRSSPAAADMFNANIKICTPISVDPAGNFYFGYVSTGVALPGYPNGIPSGLARISKAGVGSFASASAISGDATMQKVATNCSPAFSADGSTLYVAVDNGGGYQSVGYLCAVNSSTLAKAASVKLYDPRSTQQNPLTAWVSDDSSATPSVGPDGDVYYGVLEANFPSNNARGWLLHFSGDLSTSKLPSAFGWDDTASVVPSKLVTSYAGTSSYLLLTKYNNYAGVGSGDGVNKLALVDPSTSMTDPVTGVTVMKPALTVAGVTPDPEFRPTYPDAVREWCINSAAIDPINKCAVVNSEDGNVYRWDFNNPAAPLSPALMLAPATGEAYTPTAIGPDGAVYAINNAKLFSCVATSTSILPRVPAPPSAGPSRRLR